MKPLLLLFGLLLLIATEFLRIYYIMPFPGSQQENTVQLAYWIHRHRVLLRIIGFCLVAYPLWHYFKVSRTFARALLFLVVVLYAGIFFLFNYRFEADKMFLETKATIFKDAATNKVPEKRLALGLVINGQARAYPIEVIGYHHQVRDTVGGVPVLVTYCTVCRTGRVFSPVVDGRAETFRLVGMDHFNAMFEDNTTKSWWQQATGRCIAGPLKGRQLTEYPSTQSTLKTWIAEYPDAGILQPNPVFTAKYAGLATYDDGSIPGHLEHRDSASWHFKSWVIGVHTPTADKAYDWNNLAKNHLIQDTAVVVYLAPDTATFRAWNRDVNGQTLTFESAGNSQWTDINTHSTWDPLTGRSTEGPLKGAQLQSMQAYQEFWHSWKNFHPATTVGQ
ncbi:MAG TPA: DUF3179 domain-containing (seleno)protein [Dinghuibacter sp.]|uniref:DUF3179 domain-containing (seleno)protein n=1 Tax=Dinghuibacter sp. TaxID=2024697 RepID=UPI002B71A495|nr:DUF3179 domain-containing (seleno)protein [Dinghuibacter sp.]HTJ14680.1 DUF3179 domain-containing (seleno)protein [Dinghuibacter sp.]